MDIANSAEGTAPAPAPQSPEPLLTQVRERSRHWARWTLERSAVLLATWSEALRKVAETLHPKTERDGVIPEQPSAS